MNRLSRYRTAEADGAALLLALVATTIVAALGVAVLLTTETETRIVSDFGRAAEAREAAGSAIDRVITVLEPAIDWSPALSGGLTGPVDSSLRLTTPGGAAIDLDAARNDLQAETDAIAQGASNRPVWRLIMSGSLASLTGFAAGETLAYVAAWVADDWRESDGDPLTDSNGIVILRAEAWGRGGAFRALDVTLAHGEVESGCAQPVDWTYDLGRSFPAVWHGYRTHFSGSKGPDWARVVRAGFQVANPCRTAGPGATVVTWREVR